MALSPKTRNILYFVTLGLTLLVFLGGGVLDTLLPPEALEILGHLGYPAYFGRMLGIGKLLGAIVVAAPGLARAKEWAYAGFTIDLLAAAVSHGMSGDDIGKVLTPIVVLAIVLTSWALRPASRKLA